MPRGGSSMTRQLRHHHRRRAKSADSDEDMPSADSDEESECASSTGWCGDDDGDDEQIMADAAAMHSIADAGSVLAREKFLYSELLQSWSEFKQFFKSCFPIEELDAHRRLGMIDGASGSGGAATNDAAAGAGRAKRGGKRGNARGARPRSGTAESLAVAAAAMAALPPAEKLTLFTNLDLEKKRELLDMPCAIDGPWIVFLLACTSDAEDVRIYTIVGITSRNIESIERLFNDEDSNPYRQTHKHIGHWVVILAVTGFDSYDMARDYFKLWLDDARGIASRTGRGMAMFEQYRQVHSALRLYCVNLRKEEKEGSIKSWIERLQQEQRQHQQRQLIQSRHAVYHRPHQPQHHAVADF
jgi:hypothetical protein